MAELVDRQSSSLAGRDDNIMRLLRLGIESDWRLICICATITQDGRVAIYLRDRCGYIMRCEIIAMYTLVVDEHTVRREYENRGDY